jgi:hypothetical protein
MIRQQEQKLYRETCQPSHLSSIKNPEFRNTLRFFVLALIAASIALNSIVIFSNAKDKHATVLWALNISAAVATTLGITAIYRHGLHGLHGKSFLFLTLGLASWFMADISVLYYYYYFGETEVPNEFSIADVLWFTGYIFLISHLVSVIMSIRTRVFPKTLVIVALFIISYIIYTTISIGFSVEPKGTSTARNPNQLEIVTAISYPILDLCLIIPSLLILANLYHSYENSIPWVLSSLSLFFNAIADNGYVHEFVKGHHTSWFWDLLYITDFIIMAGALYWYNKFYISNALREDIED